MSKSAIVIAVSSGRCRLFRDGAEIECVVPSEMARRQRSTLAVGDRVIAEPVDGNLWRLVSILPRRTVLSRPDPLNPRIERLIAANIDVAVNVVSIKAPPLRPRLIDRFLIAIQRGGAQSAICLNKIDLVENRQLPELRPYEELGIPIIVCSTRTGEGLDKLRSLIEAKTSALVGHSGVGKSSILNALDARLQLATADVQTKRGTGRHPTSASTLFDLGNETYVIDTPGIREFGLWDITPESLRQAFPEFEEAAEWCRFNDCTHLHEPDCEVKKRVERGEISPARYDAYLRLATESERSR